MNTEALPMGFPNKGIQYYIFCCIGFWIMGAMLLFTYSDKEIFYWVNQQHHPLLDSMMSWITRIGELWGIIPLAIIPFFFPPKKSTKLLVLVIICCNVVPMLINVSLKNILALHRPMHYFEHEPWLHFVTQQPKQYNLSFPSGHTEGIFAIMTTLALLLRNKWSWMAILLFAIALLTGYSRIYLVQHFFKDVLAGSMIGTIFSLLTYAALSKWIARKETKIV